MGFLLNFYTGSNSKEKLSGGHGLPFITLSQAEFCNLKKGRWMDFM